jgi:hypothetical protein
MNEDAVRALRGGTPLGHSLSAHHVHGWCSHCPGRTPAEELGAWQVWALTLLTTVEEGARGGA